MANEKDFGMPNPESSQFNYNGEPEKLTEPSDAIEKEWQQITTAYTNQEFLPEWENPDAYILEHPILLPIPDKEKQVDQVKRLIAHCRRKAWPIAWEILPEMPESYEFNPKVALVKLLAEFEHVLHRSETETSENDTFPLNTNGKIVSSPARSVISLFGSQPQGTALSAAGLSGQISIEQANLYRQASIIVNDALLVMQGIEPFSPLVDQTQLETLRSLIIAEIQTLLDEFGRVDEPRTERVQAYLSALRGIGGSIKGGHLTEFGRVALLDRSFGAATPSTLADEAQIAAYELMQSYAASLADIWNRFKPEFDAVGSPLFSERVSRASLLLSVINEGNVNWMAAMDSIGFTENERRSKATKLSLLQGFTALLPGSGLDLGLPDMTVNDLNEWLDRYSNLEGPTMMTDSGLYGLEFITDQADQLFWTVAGIVGFVKTSDVTSATNKPVLVQAMLHERVSWALDDILNQLKSLADLAA